MNKQQASQIIQAYQDYRHGDDPIPELDELNDALDFAIKELGKPDGEFLNNHNMQPIKWYNLTKGDRAKHGDEILTFHRPDGMYASWRDAEGLTRIGQSDEYVLGDDGIYIPYVPDVGVQD